MLHPLLEARIAKIRSEFQTGLARWRETHFRTFPWRDSEADVFGVVVAEVLLRRTTAKAAARLYPEIIARYPTPTHFAAADIANLAEQLGPLGLNWQRAEQLISMGRHLVDVHRGLGPNDLQRLLDLPGLGAYGARAVLSFGFDVPTAVLDSNIKRILKRVFNDWLSERTSAATLLQIADLLGVGSEHRAQNFALLDLGALVCRYARPRCATCPLMGICTSALDE